MNPNFAYLTNKILDHFMKTDMDHLQMGDSETYQYNEDWEYEWQKVHNPDIPEVIYLTFWVKPKKRDERDGHGFLVLNHESDGPPDVLLSGDYNLESYGRVTLDEWMPHINKSREDFVKYIAQKGTVV